MSPNAYTEDQLVEQPAIGLFAALGWQTASALDESFGPAGALGRETKGEVVLVGRLRDAGEGGSAFRESHHPYHPNLGVNGGTMGSVNKGISESMEIVSPPNALLANHHSLASPLFADIFVLQRHVQNPRRTRDLMLLRLLSGQIDVEVMPA